MTWPARGLPLLAVLIVAGACASGPSTASTSSATTATTTTTEESTMRLTSPAFDDGGPIPVRYTCDGEDVSPPLDIADLPEGTQTLVLVMDDPDAPVGTWDHWVAYDITPAASIPEDIGALGTAGRNSWGRTGYGGPCPPSGTHGYIFVIHALSGWLDLGEGATKSAVLAAAEPLRLDSATLTGTYSR